MVSSPQSQASTVSQVHREGLAKLTLPLYVDSSMLSTWRACRRKFFWSTLHSLYPPGKSVHLIAGGAFAAGMEAARRLAFKDAPHNRPTHDDLLHVAYRAFAREWGDYTPTQATNKTFENTFQALDSYLREYPPQTEILQPFIRKDGSPTVEYTFAIPIEDGPRHPETNDPFLFSGRFDLLGTYGGLPCIADEKTTERMGFAWDSQWDLRGQFMGYIWACQQQGYELNTAVIRGICLLKNEFKFATSIKQFPQHLIDRWYRQLLMDLSDIDWAYRLETNKVHGSDGEVERHRAFPYNFADSCAAYGGCAFTALCAASEPEAFFTMFTRHRWDPLAKQPLKEQEPANA